MIGQAVQVGRSALRAAQSTSETVLSGENFAAELDSLEYFLTERCCSTTRRFSGW